jgi:activator of 2-hydroxyglutaryl-CoA dehydratase
MDDRDYLKHMIQLKRDFLAQIGRANSTAKKEMINEFDKLMGMGVELFSLVINSTQLENNNEIEIAIPQPVQPTHQMADGTIMPGETHQESEENMEKRMELERRRELERQNKLLKEREAAQQVNTRQRSTGAPSTSTSGSSSSGGGGGY